MSEPVQPYKFSTHTTDYDPGIGDAMDSLRAERSRLEAELTALIHEKVSAFRDRTGVMVDQVSVGILETVTLCEKAPRPHVSHVSVSLRL